MEFQLPTEAQWEFAARGGNMRKEDSRYQFSGREDIEPVAWYASNSKEETHPVKTKGHNELGIYDMSGNVWEWCQDEYKLYDNKENNLAQPNNNDSKRVGRGGCWHSERKYCRVSYRDKANMTHAGNGLGMRLVLSAKRK